jgi:hypothetical protein
MSLLARARKFIEDREKEFTQEKEDWNEEELQVLREEALRRGILSSPNEKLNKIEWPSALKAARLLLLQCGKSPDSDTLDAVAALLLYLSDPAEKGEKGEKPEVHYGLTHAEARVLLTRVCLGQRICLTDCGQIGAVDD